MRSGIGYFSKRKDLAVLAIVFGFGALLNAFGMVSPIYAFEQWLAKLFHVNTEFPVLASVFVLILVIEPLLLIGVASWITRVWGGSRRPWLSLAVRYSYSLVPVGFGIWLAHYSFHFLTGLYTFIPVTQSAFADFGWAMLGQPHWSLPGLAPNVVQLFEFGFITLGLLGSLLVSYSIAMTEEVVHPVRAFIPWAMLSLLMAGAAFWLLTQPMEMRGIVLGSG
jgi:hypothetical protein